MNIDFQIDQQNSTNNRIVKYEFKLNAFKSSSSKATS